MGHEIDECPATAAIFVPLGRVPLEVLETIAPPARKPGPLPGHGVIETGIIVAAKNPTIHMVKASNDFRWNGMYFSFSHEPPSYRAYRLQLSPYILPASKRSLAEAPSIPLNTNPKSLLLPGIALARDIAIRVS